MKHLNLLKKQMKNQETASILKVVFVLSKRPHFHRAYLVTVRKREVIAVHEYVKKDPHLGSQATKIYIGSNRVIL